MQATDYRLQWEHVLGPDAQVFQSEQEASDYAATHHPEDWESGRVWVISEEQP